MDKGARSGRWTGKDRVRDRLKRSIVTMALSVLFVMGAMATFGIARAQAADPTQLSVTASASGTSVQVSGVVRSSSGQGIPGLAVSIAINDSSSMTATLSDGTFSYTMAVSGAGNYTVRAQWAGDSRYAPAVGTTLVSIAYAQTSMTLAVDPAEVPPGSAVTVTGSLTSGGTPISSALVTLSVDYGSVDPLVSTGGDGSFTAGITIPEGEGFPAGYTVTAEYQGDDLFTAASSTARGSIVAPPSPTPAADQTSAMPLPSISPTMPTLTSQASPTSGIMNAPTDSSNEGSSPMAIVTIIFFVVALVSVGVLVILGVVSHAQKRLGRDERRGFGTTFGKLW